MGKARSGNNFFIAFIYSNRLINRIYFIKIQVEYQAETMKAHFQLKNKVKNKGRIKKKK